MSPAFAESEERFASVVRAGTGRLEIAGAEFPVMLAALHHGDLFLGVSCEAATASLTASRSRCELFDVIGREELGPHAAALLSPCRGCAGGCAPSRGDSMLRQFADIHGAASFLDATAERRTALELAESMAHPALLAVGQGVRLVQLFPDTITLFDGTGADPVDPADLDLAEPDPFCDLEAHWLARINDPRSGVVTKLLAHLERRADRGGPDVLREPAASPGPVLATALDRFGVTLSARNAYGVRRHWRLGFAGDCATVTDLATELRALCGEGGGVHSPGPLLRDRGAR